MKRGVGARLFFVPRHMVPRLYEKLISNKPNNSIDKISNDDKIILSFKIFLMAKDIFMETPNPRDPVFIVKDLETLKVLSDPLRIQILEVLEPKPQTVNQVAERLGLSNSRLYYHFNMLEAHGLIKVVETRFVNNMMEKDYWVTAEEIEIDKDLLNFSSESGQESILQIIKSSWEATLEEILRSLQSRTIQLAQNGQENPRKLVMVKLYSRLSDETYAEFVEKFNKLLEEFKEPEDSPAGDADLNDFSLACFIYPNYTYVEEPGTD